MSQDDATEHVREEIQHHAEHGAHAPSEKWIAGAALTAAILAALAAIGGTLAETHLTESNRTQIESNDLWGQYQAKSIKLNILKAKQDVLQAIATPAATNKALDKDEVEKLADYDKELKGLHGEAQSAADSSKGHLHRHEVFEHGVTLFHIAIAIVAIAVLTKRRSFWYGSMACGAIGLVFLVQGLLH